MIPWYFPLCICHIDKKSNTGTLKYIPLPQTDNVRHNNLGDANDTTAACTGNSTKYDKSDNGVRKPCEQTAEYVDAHCNAHSGLAAEYIAKATVWKTGVSL